MDDLLVGSSMRVLNLVVTPFGMILLGEPLYE